MVVNKQQGDRHGIYTQNLAMRRCNHREWTTDEHNNDVGTLDKTWQEIFDAYPNAYLMDDGIKYIIITVGSEGGQYGVESRVDMFTANDPNGYPMSESGSDVI